MEHNFVKITGEVYKMLEVLPDSDPLKNKAKEKALAILENATLIFSAQGWVSLQKEKEYHVIKSGVKPPQGLIRQSLEMSYSLAPGDIKKITASPSLNKLESPGKETSPSQ